MSWDLPDLIVTGLQEAFSPPLMAIAGALGMLFLLLRPSGADVLRAFFLNFMVTLILLRVFFDSGVANSFALAPWFLVWAIGAYLILGVFFLVAGIAFLVERQAFIRDRSLPLAAFLPGLKLGKGAVLLLAVVVAVVSALWINAWPLSYQVVVHGTLLFTLNGFLDSLWVLVIYEFCRSIGCLFAGGMFFWYFSRSPAGAFGTRKTLVAVMMSAAYLAAGVSLIFFCYMALVGPR